LLIRWAPGSRSEALRSAGGLRVVSDAAGGRSPYRVNSARRASTAPVVADPMWRRDARGLHRHWHWLSVLVKWYS